MYRCDLCGEVTPPRTPSIRRAVTTRPKIYPLRTKANRIRTDGRVRHRDDPGGEGVEIVVEITICPDCAG